MISQIRWSKCVLFLLLLVSVRLCAELPSFDFRASGEAAGWQPTHDVGALTQTEQGLAIPITGSDPYINGPARDYPADQPLWLRLRLRADRAGTCQVFYYVKSPTESDSVRFAVPGNAWHEVKVRVPPLGPGYRLRVDPPGVGGECLLAWIRVEERTVYASPTWIRPRRPALGSAPAAISAGPLALVHGADGFDGFEVRVEGQTMACGNDHAMVGYVAEDSVRWLDLGDPERGRFRVTYTPVTQLADATVGGAVQSELSYADPDGGTWTIKRTFRPGRSGTIEVYSQVTVDRDRDVLYLPLFTLLAGLGEYGTNKTQGLFAGLEYLANEPSSSTADLNPPASHRQVPDTAKITFPLMAIAADDRYVGLVWNRDRDPDRCAVFDSPDRLFDSGGHLLGLLFPGSDGVNRDENSLVPYATTRIRAHRSIRSAVLIIGGRGESVVPAVRQYVDLNALPTVPELSITPETYYRLAARGWLDSRIRAGNQYRHAFWDGFRPQPSADAAWTMDWLADRVGESDLARRLTQAARAALGEIAPADYNTAQIGHVRYPLPALIYGRADECVGQAATRARQLLRRFAADGSVRYNRAPDKPDFGRTHWATEANGLTGQAVADLLKTAVFSGDRELIQAGLERLRGLDKFDHTVPRGAQTWEIPLHTPDILASAHLVSAYTLGYELSGDPALLDRAKYWAWTGVPFVYLTPPTPEPIGLYNTIPVLGATSWVAPVWIGRPVQWCGLVYADALYRFAKHDSAGPWKTLADGIALAGIEHTWPETDSERLGLLPDFFQLKSQVRDGPAINPATVLLPALRALGEPLVYDFAALRSAGLQVHAPGEIALEVETPNLVRFRVQGWSSLPYEVLVTGVANLRGVRVDGARVPIGDACRWSPDEGRVVLVLDRTRTVELEIHKAAR